MACFRSSLARLRYWRTEGNLAMVESLVLTAASQYAMRSHRKPRSLPSVRPHDTSRPRSASRLFLGNHAFPSPFAATRLRHEG